MIDRRTLEVACYGDCGCVVQYVTNKRVYCTECKAKAKRESARIAMEKVRRKRGIAPVKGTTSACVDCDAAFVRFNWQSKRCRPCQAEFAMFQGYVSSVDQKTIPERKQRMNDWFKRKRATDPAFRVSSHFRVLMHRAITKRKAGRSWRTFVDYSIDELMQHLEKQFAEGMTWDNLGEWHIDHIIPRSRFNYDSPYDPEFKACWSLPNLRPLWRLENIRKNAKTLYLI